MLAALEFWDYAIIAIIVIVFAGGSVTYAARNGSEARLARLERKLDAILRHLNVPHVDPASSEGLSEEVKALANDSAQKIQAIKLLREQTGLGLREAKDAIDAYVAGRG